MHMGHLLSSYDHLLTLCGYPWPFVDDPLSSHGHPLSLLPSHYGIGYGHCVIVIFIVLMWSHPSMLLPWCWHEPGHWHGHGYWCSQLHQVSSKKRCCLPCHVKLWWWLRKWWWVSSKHNRGWPSSVGHYGYEYLPWDCVGASLSVQEHNCRTSHMTEVTIFGD